MWPSIGFCFGAIFLLVFHANTKPILIFHTCHMLVIPLLSVWCVDHLYHSMESFGCDCAWIYAVFLMCSRVHFHIYSVCVHTSVYDSEGACKCGRVYSSMLYYLPFIGLHVCDVFIFTPSTSVDSFGSLYREMCSNGLAMQRQSIKLSLAARSSSHSLLFRLLKWARLIVSPNSYCSGFFSPPFLMIISDGLAMQCQVGFTIYSSSRSLVLRFVRMGSPHSVTSS